MPEDPAEPDPDHLVVDDRTRVRREAERQVTERSALHAVLDAALVAHVAVVRDGLPVVLPFACARDGEALLLHGSTGAGLMRLASGAPVCVSVTHLDGLVFARTAFESSMRYRSATVHGEAEVLSGEEMERALEVLTDHLFPGRTRELRRSSGKELAATLVLRVALTGRASRSQPDRRRSTRRHPTPTSRARCGPASCRWPWSPASPCCGPTYRRGRRSPTRCTGRWPGGTARRDRGDRSEPP